MAQVRAGGGVVLRRKRNGKLRVVVIHRPSYDDWTLPKGKADAGEAYEEAALREVAEETGLECTAVTELSSFDYVDGRGRTKRVRYWLMVPGEDTTLRAHVDDEIDDVRWVGLGKARQLLTYNHDRDLLDEGVACFQEWA